MAIYRKDWTSSFGWLMRLDIIPYDETLSGAVTLINTADVTITEMEDYTREFDEIPIGLIKDSSLSLKIVLSSLPSALRTRLRNKESGTAPNQTRNLFLLWSDRGEGTYVLEGAFVQAGIGGNVYSRKGGKTFTTIDLTDAAYWLMTDTTAELVLGGIDTNSDPIYQKLYEVGFPTVDRSDAYNDAGSIATGWSKGFFVTSWATLMGLFADAMTPRWTAKVARTTNVSTAATVDAFDVGNDWQQGLFSVVEFKDAVDAEPRTAWSTLTSSSLQLITGVYNDADEHIGGLLAQEDKYGWAQYATVVDLFKDLAETFASKVYYHVLYNAGAGNPYLSVEWWWVPVGADQTGDAASATLDTGKALSDESEVDELAIKIGQAEVRWESNGSDDVTEHVVKTGASRGARSFNVRGIMTNAPVCKPDGIKAFDGGGKMDYISKGLFQTNLLCYVSGGTVFKVHEYVKILDTFTSGTVYDDSTLHTVPNEAFSSEGLAAYNLWVKQNQTTQCLAFAVASSLARVWGSDNIATVEFEWRLSDYGASVLCDAIGRLHNLTGAITTELPQFDWAHAIVTKVSPNFVTGKSKITYTLRAA